MRPGLSFSIDRQQRKNSHDRSVVSDLEAGRGTLLTGGWWIKGVRGRRFPVLWTAVAVVVLILYLGAGSRTRNTQGQKFAASEAVTESALHGSHVHSQAPQEDVVAGQGKVIQANSKRKAVHVGQQDEIQFDIADSEVHSENVRRLSDNSIRCKASSICDGLRSTCAADPDGLACIKDETKRQEQVLAAIQRAWRSYRRCAWGYDEVLPISCKGNQWFGLGLAMIDSLDTLILAGLHEEVEEVAQWITALDTAGQPGANTNVFECTIRVVGGLLSAAHLLDGDKRLLRPAIEVALRLLVAFNSKSGIPYSDVDLKSITARQPTWTAYSSLSEATTLSLEFCHVARVAGYDALSFPALHVWKVMNNVPGSTHGLAPIYVAPDAGASGRFGGEDITLGARGDSYYEYSYRRYMLKQYIISGRKDMQILEMYHKAMQGVRELLVGRTAPLDVGGLLYIGERTARSNHNLTGKMDHLVCFLPGVLALGHFHGVETGTETRQLGDLDLAQHLMHTCYSMYRFTPTGLAPELVHFVERRANGSQAGEHDEDMFSAFEGEVGGGHFKVKPMDSHNILRPETVESLFVLWRVTGDVKYQDWGWQIFRAFEMHARLDEGGYASLDSVLSVPATKRDKTESFFIAETLKYFFLLFSPPEVLPFESYVFNTEAHPLPIIDSPVEKLHSAWYLTAPAGLNASVTLESQALLELISEFRQAWDAQESGASRTS